MTLLDAQHPFFRPLWRRVVVVVLCLGWGLFELFNGSSLWAMLFIGAGVYSGWQFFVASPPEPEVDKAFNEAGGADEMPSKGGPVSEDSTPADRKRDSQE